MASPRFYIATKLCCRGEKLYVTKDKRSRNSYWRRMAWGCALLVVVIAVIIAILAASKTASLLILQILLL